LVLEAIPFGIAIGLALGALGGGGSVLAVPVLVYVLGENVHEATTASLLVVIAGATAGSLAHHRVGRVCWRHAGTFSVAAIPGVVAGTAAGDALGDSLLVAAFAGVMLVAAAGTWRRAERETDLPGRSLGTCPPLHAWRDITAGAAIGFATGFFGVGGGFLIVPTLAVALAFSMRLAVATSLAIITTTSVLGVAAHLVAGRAVDMPVTLAMAAACAVGAYAGGRLAPRVPQRALGRAFALVVLLVAGYLLASAAFLGGPPSGG
jgi:uncharacterized membrane protein YfcA